MFIKYIIIIFIIIKTGSTGRSRKLFVWKEDDFFLFLLPKTWKRSRWKLSKQTMIRVRINPVQHTQYSNVTSNTMTSNFDQGKAWLPDTPGARKVKDDIEQLTPTPENNTQGLGEKMHHFNEATHRCPQRHASPTSKYKFSERQEKQYHAHGLRRWACMLSDFTQRMSRLGLAQMETPDKTKSPWGGFAVLQDILTTKALVLYGICTVQRYMFKMILLTVR